MTVRRKIKKPEQKAPVDSGVRPAENYKVVTGTKAEREGVHMLFGTYQSRTEANLIKRLDVLKWSHDVLGMLEKKGFIEVADWSIDQKHYIRRLFRK